MGWHVHCKNGEYAVWSTIVDEYITPWTSKEQIRAKYVYRAALDAMETADELIEEAERSGCSVIYPIYKCKIIRPEEHEDYKYVVESIRCANHFCGLRGTVAAHYMYAQDGQRWYECLDCGFTWNDLDNSKTLEERSNLYHEKRGT